MPSKSFVGVLILLALAVGYIVGSERAGQSLPVAMAGPTEANTPGTFMYSDSHAYLTVWRITEGRVTDATMYSLDTDTTEGPNGERVETRTISEKAYAPPAQAPSKGK